MRTSIKAALAAAAGGGLLLGGAGSLAYWDDDEDIPTETVTSGQLDLAAPDCDSTDWKLDDGSAFDPASDTLVPGDTLTRVCHFALTVTGEHLEAEFEAAAPTKQAGALSDELVLSADYEIDADTTDNGGGAESAVDPEGAVTGAADIGNANDGDYLRAVVTVSFPFGAGVDNDSNGGVASVLDAITVTATQTDFTGH